jgi:hypothetical protein
VVNNHEEFYAALMFLVERHYLKEWGRNNHLKKKEMA